MTTEKAVGMRAAVVGVGRMGVRHIQVLKKLQMDVSAIADVSPDACSAVSKEFDVPSSGCFEDALEMLRTVRPEAVVISTTAPTHARFTCAAAEAGAQFILCEKPMATSLADVAEMRETCRRNGARLAVNHQMRFMPQYTRVKDLIKGSDDAGPLASIVVAGSNFGLAMNASHYFEMFRYMTDSPVESVQAWLEAGQLSNPRGPRFEDRSGRVLARNANGVSMFIDFSRSAGHGLQVVYICRNAQIVVDELSGDVRMTSRQAEYRDLPTSRYAMPADVQLMVIEGADTLMPTMSVWVSLLEEGSFPDGVVGQHAVACLVAAHISHETGMPTRIGDVGAARSRQFTWA
jgi:predicted dehydrogenase